MYSKVELPWSTRADDMWNEVDEAPYWLYRRLLEAQELGYDVPVPTPF